MESLFTLKLGIDPTEDGESLFPVRLQFQKSELDEPLKDTGTKVMPDLLVPTEKLKKGYSDLAKTYTESDTHLNKGAIYLSCDGGYKISEVKNAEVYTIEGILQKSELYRIFNNELFYTYKEFGLFGRIRPISRARVSEVILDVPKESINEYSLPLLNLEELNFNEIFTYG